MQSTTGKRLHARLGHGEAWAALRLEGVIDEHNGLDQMVDRLPARPILLIDLGRVTRINSVGVRDWVLWLRRLRSRFDTIVLFDCPPSIMNEVNLVKNFAEGAIIATFQAPYYCERCGKEDTHTLDALAMQREGIRKAPSFPCGKDACANALDDVEESYFAFFADQAEREPPADLPEILEAARRALDDREATEFPPAASGPSAPVPRRPLESIGQRATQARRQALAQVTEAPAQPDAPTPPPGAPRGELDLVFAAVLGIMLAVLGVLIYLITTLE